MSLRYSPRSPSGGVTPVAFPAAHQVIDFIAACEREAVPFKATAGLHHAVRGDYRLTYEPESPVSTMYGFDFGSNRATRVIAFEGIVPL